MGNMENSNKKRFEQLGMPIGTAQNKLRKLVMFQLIKKLGLNVCFQCKKEIEKSDDLSIEHKIPWLDSKNPKELFFDLNNIAFSHQSCNYSAGRHALPEHGTRNMYENHECRCELCTKRNTEHAREQRNKEYIRLVQR